MCNRHTIRKAVPINMLTTTVDDPGFVDLKAHEDYKINEYTLQNFRTMNYTRNPCYTFPFQPKLHDHLGIAEGQGPGMNPNLDSELTRGELSNKTGFNLHEKVSFGKYFDYLPNYQTPFYNNKGILIATSPPVNPQKYYNGVFQTFGVNTRNYNRLSDETYRSIALLTNETRKKSKICNN